MMPKLHTIGSVAGKHGFNGSVTLSLKKDGPGSRIKKGNFLFIIIDGKGVPFLIENYQEKNGILKLQDIDSEEDSLEILGLEVALEATGDEDQDFRWYEGFEVFSGENTLVGALEGIEKFPAGEMLKVSRNGAEILIPAVPAWILKIDEKKKRLIMSLPEGLLDI